MKTVKQIKLQAKHIPTQRTHHHIGEKEIPPTDSLKIVEYENTEGYYLLHYDANGIEIADTFHESIDDAFAQAEWEYNIKPNEWD